MFKAFYLPKYSIIEYLKESRGDFNDSAIPAVGMVIGKFSPLTVGHKKMIDQLIAKCTQLDITPVIALIDTGTTNSTDRLLTGDERKELIHRAYGDQVEVVLVSNAFQALVNVKETGGDLELLVCGDDRVEQYKGLTSKIFDSDYQDVPPSVESIPRSLDADSDVASSASSTKARQAARDGDIKTFTNIVGLPAQQAVELMQLLISRMENSNGNA